MGKGVPSQTVPSDATGVLTIDLDALADNWRKLKAQAAPAQAAAVIKANGYGLGVERVGRKLYDAGCRMFFVAHPSEGVRARAVLPSDAPIYILNGLQANADPRRDYLEHGLAPVIGSADELAHWRTLPQPAPFALHVDTGMNRLGFESAEALAAAIRRFGAEGANLLISHFVSAEEPENPLNASQQQCFERARKLLPDVPASLANSSGGFLPDIGGDWVRLGYGLYGGNPTPGRANPMRAVATLDVAIQQTRWIEPGETCGYNGQWTAHRRTRLATLLAGYADGLPFGLGATDIKQGASAFIAGVECPLVGRVSMDLTIADVTDAPEAEARPGAYARLFGPDASFEEFARRSGVIGYQVLTNLGPRYARIIKG